MKKLSLIIKLLRLKLSVEWLILKLIYYRIHNYGFILGLVKCNINPITGVLFILLVGVFILGSLLRLLDERLGSTGYLTIIAIALPIEIMGIVQKYKKK